MILGEDRHQQEAQRDVDYGGQVAEGTKESRRYRVNNSNLERK